MNKEIKQALKQVRNINTNQFVQMSAEEVKTYKAILQHVLARQQYYEKAVHDAYVKCVSLKNEYDILRKRISHLGENDQQEKKALLKMEKRTKQKYFSAKKRNEKAYEELKGYAVVSQMADVKLCRIDFAEKQVAEIMLDNQKAKEEYIKRRMLDDTKDVFAASKPDKQNGHDSRIKFDLNDDISTPCK